MANNNLELDDIQGLIVRSYTALPAACYLLLNITDSQHARPWLRDIIGQITYADMPADQEAINIAFTQQGISKLNIDQTIIDSFSNEFRAGMTTTHKSHILGDEGDSEPKHWLWGGPETQTVHLLMLCYSKTQASLNNLVHRLKIGMRENGLHFINQLDTQILKDNKEHFGFRDGIAQPYISEFNRHKEDGKKEASKNAVALGELLLGHENGYKRFTQRPMVKPELDPFSLLKPCRENAKQHDLGFNGTYLVFRQLFQDVPGFWKSLKQLETEKNPENADPIHLAAKMVGRWPSGTSLVQSPLKDDPGVVDQDNFTYHKTDEDGLKCPLGAHIRRTNPRDSLEPEPGTQKSTDFSNRHRIIRRGRAYGKPFEPSMKVENFLLDLEKEDKAPVSRGLHFICLNANIGRQFEFIQHTWANNPNFNGLYRDSDPIIGTRFANGKEQDQFTVQQCPARTQYRGLPSFVQMRGGGYFFVPSRRALNFLLSSKPVK